MANKKIIGSLIAIFLIAGVAGGFVGYNFPRLDFGSFNPTIDGDFQNSDGWQYADWQFAEYLLTDVNSSDAYNYFYIHLSENYLYILIDLVSDITPELEDEWISIWFDTDNSRSYYSDISWNEAINSPGEEMLYYIPKTDSFNQTLNYRGKQFNSTLNSSNVMLEYGFQKTPNSQKDHRIYEIRVDKNDLRNLNTTYFNIGFFGYGTLASISATDSWGAPSDFSSLLYYLGYLEEVCFFR